MNAETVLASIESLNTTISELESLRTLHLMEAQKMISFIIHDLHERMNKLKTASEHPTDFPSIVSVYTGHLSDFNRQLVTLERLAVTAKVYTVQDEINIFKEFYSSQKVKL
ncbi:MAG TPA: hypothetical protein VGD26_08495 [Chitinophagaceae bacterium]